MLKPLKPPHSKRDRDCRASPNRAKRLDCGVFTAAFHPPPRHNSFRVVFIVESSPSVARLRRPTLG